ncbi:MAG: hypothetical protein P1V20_05280 [Verrucomicrobiales bacterium]|nr:hypothetical protein [Verrucomicrobiales bacterium]
MKYRGEIDDGVVEHGAVAFGHGLQLLRGTGFEKGRLVRLGQCRSDEHSKSKEQCD